MDTSRQDLAVAADQGKEQHHKKTLEWIVTGARRGPEISSSHDTEINIAKIKMGQIYPIHRIGNNKSLRNKPPTFNSLILESFPLLGKSGECDPPFYPDIHRFYVFF